MTVYRADPLTPQDAPDLAPLRNSHEANQLETELKGLFMMMLGEFVRAGEREVNTVGTPHLGPFEQIERAVKAEGLALFRREDQNAMARVFRAWRARNPKRGLHMLRCYLQLLWPDGWALDQLYQLKSEPYPTSLSFAGGPTRYLTSRVRVCIQSPDITGDAVVAAVPAMRSVVPARILLEFAMLTVAETQVGLACHFMTGFTFQRFEGTFV